MSLRDLGGQWWTAPFSRTGRATDANEMLSKRRRSLHRVIRECICHDSSESCDQIRAKVTSARNHLQHGVHGLTSIDTTPSALRRRHGTANLHPISKLHYETLGHTPTRRALSSWSHTLIVNSPPLPTMCAHTPVRGDALSRLHKLLRPMAADVSCDRCFRRTTWHAHARIDTTCLSSTRRAPSSFCKRSPSTLCHSVACDGGRGGRAKVETVDARQHDNLGLNVRGELVGAE